MMEQQHCHSCGMPMMDGMMNMASQSYCKFCTDDQGNLKSKEDVQQGIAMWLQQWGPPGGNYMQRAMNYMMAMPAWAQE